MRTTLYEKMFIDGFCKPSYVVATLELARPVPSGALAEAIVATLDRHARLRSVVRTVLGVPVAFSPRPARAWLERGGLRHLGSADVGALEERLLGEKIDIVRSLPLEIYAVADPPSLVIKLHHAVIDASSGFAVLRDFVRALGGHASEPRSLRSRPPFLRRAREWTSRARIAPRLPEVGLVARYHPAGALDEEPVARAERLLRGAYARLSARARARGVTFFELVASSLLSAMHRYNVAFENERAPDAVGLMFARARPRAGEAGASFRADTRAVSIPAARLATPHDPVTFAALRRAVSDVGHDDLALATLYALRKLRGRPSAPSTQRAVFFTLSDMTAFGARRSSPMPPQLAITGVRVLASPTSFDHAGMLVSRFHDDVRLSIVSHRFAVDGDALLEATVRFLEES